MARIMESIRKELLSRCIQEGYKKTKGGCWYKSGLSENFQRLVFFSFCTYTDYRTIDVFVGIRNLLVERIHEKLINDKVTYPVVILRHNIGYLAPEHRYKGWVVTEHTNRPPVYDEIFHYVDRYANQFYDKCEDIPRLIEMLSKNPKEREASSTTVFLILPLLYYLSGNKEAGIQIMDEMVQNGFSLKQDFFKNYYNNFCKLEL